MKVSKKQPELKIELVSSFPSGTVFRMKSKASFEEDFVAGNLYMKVSQAETSAALTDQKFSFIRLGNKFELIHRQGPFLGSEIEVEQILFHNEKTEKTLEECSPGDAVQFHQYESERFVIVTDPVESNGLITLVKLIETNESRTSDEIVKMDRSLPCLKSTISIRIK